MFGCTEQKQFLLVDSDQNLNDLNDVEISSPTNTQALIYQSSTGLWKNLAQAGAGGGGRTYTGLSPISVDNDNNIVALNVLSTSDWNGTFDGFQGTQLMKVTDYNVQTLRGGTFGLGSFRFPSDANAIKFNATDFNSGSGKIFWNSISFDMNKDFNKSAISIGCTATQFMGGDGLCHSTGSTDINGTDVNPNFVKITTDLNVLRDANILQVLNVYGNIKGFSNLTIAGTMTADSGTFGSGINTVGIATAARSIVFGSGGDAEISTPNNLFLRTTGGGNLQLAGFTVVVPETDNAVDLGVDAQRFEYLKLSKVGYARDFNALGDINGTRFCIGTDCKTAWPAGGSGAPYFAGGNLVLSTTPDVNTFHFNDANYLDFNHTFSAGRGFMFGAANNRIWSNANGTVSIDANTKTQLLQAGIPKIITGLTGMTLGSGEAGVDYRFSVDAESNDGSFDWMEDESYFRHNNDILMSINGAVSRKLYFFDTGLFIDAQADGQLRISSDDQINISSTGATLVSGSTRFSKDLNNFAGKTNIGDLNATITKTRDLNVTVDANINGKIKIDGNVTANSDIIITQNKRICLNVGCTAYLTYDGTKSIWVGG